MSTLDLIRSLRRALASLRDAQDPNAVNEIARALAFELEVKLGQLSGEASDPPDLSALDDRFHSEAEDVLQLGLGVYA